jgi:iron complex outermembrane receptor protein
MAADADLGTITIKEKVTTKVVENVSGEEVKSADLAEALHKKVPSVNMVRRSGIANDIVLRGQKRDNITVTIDGAFVCGACPNRMDPPTSHVVTSNIENVKISEGPFDVENMGSMSGNVKVETKKPTKDLSGEVYLNAGSFGYKKAGATVSGGTDKVKVMVTASSESGEQYVDGDGKSFADQLRTATDGTMQSSMQYSDTYKDMDAFEKKSVMGKAIVDITDNQDLELSFTQNESDNVLYPNSKMDAIYDDSNILNLKYTANDMGTYSKKLQVKYYSSDVEHPMSTKFRKSSGTNSVNEVISKLTTEKSGTKIINDMDIDDAAVTVGFDTSDRNWDGAYIGYGTKQGITGRKAIDDVDTKNNALFAKYNKDYDKLNIEVGARYNDTTISTGNATYTDRDFNSVDMNIFATYSKGNGAKYFAGIGKASRVPDGRELYFNSSMNVMSGTPTLDQTTNTEIDLGVEMSYDNAYVKAKVFYSMLDNYIYFNSGNIKKFLMMGNPTMASMNSFENIDATIYGLELNGNYDINDKTMLDFGLAYQVGKKDKALTSKITDTTSGQTVVSYKQQTDKDLADITPLKTTIGINYDQSETLNGRVELVSAKSWDKFDEDNGEQKIDGYNVINLKVQKIFAKNFELTVGADNLFDKTYAVSNTYSDLILLSDGTTGDVMLINEPGRYLYTNLKYKF